MSKFSRWASRNPLAAVWLGAVLFLIVMFATASWYTHTTAAVKVSAARSQ
jgi:hypothetical protein